MIRRFFILALVMISSLIGYAQKKEIAAARDQIKSGKNLDKAEAAMMMLLEDSTKRDQKKIWLTLFSAQREQYEQGNEKLYLKQAYDTAQLFVLVRKMFETLEAFDSIDAKPDKQGKVRPEYRRRHAEFLNEYRPNLYNGGLYFIRKQNYAEGYRYMDMYINNAHQPMFRDYQYNEKDKKMPLAAYWAVYCGWKMKNPQATLRHTYLALKDSTHADLMLQYLAETYLLEQDTVRYVKTLSDGFMHYPRFRYFFPRLMEYYSTRHELDSAMSIVNKALTHDPKNEIYHFAKSIVLLNSEKYNDCITLCDSLLSVNDSLRGAYLNAGLAYFNKAVEIDKNARAINKKTKGRILENYEKSRQYLERYRQLAPDQKERWGMPLYTIYLNLNMGEQFDEIDKILRNGRK